MTSLRESNYWHDTWDDLTSFLNGSHSMLSAARKPRMAERDTQEGIFDFIAATMDLSFSETLLHMIDCKGMTDVQVYKAAGIDRRVFSRLRSSRDYQPSRKTAIRLCLAMRLTPGEAMMLLEKAGLCLSRSKKDDLVVLYCLQHGIHQIEAVNEALDRLGLENLD